MDHSRFCLVCCRYSEQQEPLEMTSQGPTCEDCIDWVREQGDDYISRAYLLRESARRRSCPSCGSMRRNNVECHVCRTHLLNRGLSNLLYVVMTSRVVQP